jgi:Acyl carrier protein
VYYCNSSVYKLLNIFRRKRVMVFEKIREIIAEQTGKNVEEITLETNVKEDLDADSLDLFQIINDIEDEFEVSVENPEAIVTVKDAVDFVESHK